MPTSFLTDDQLYEGYERGSMAEERTDERTESASLASEVTPSTDTASDNNNVNDKTLTIGRLVADSVGTMGILSVCLPA